uniref:Pentacotripeptide-repeat region of PRORP domain-containing protein n=1 Tax=Salix viminalis TaxID=40686 RepID=A0A6N2MPV1_SALVM
MVSEAQCVFDIMPEKGVEPNVITYNALTNGLCNEGKIKDAVELFNEMVRRGHEPDVITYNTLINGLCKTGNTSMAVHVFKKMEQHACKPDVVTYNTIIDNLCKHRLVGRPQEALNLFKEMCSYGCFRFDDLLDFARWLLQTWAFGRGIKTAQGNAREETRT